MENNQESSNNIIDNNIQGYNICAGKGCNNIGKNHLKILFINKSGWFCEFCKEDLINLKLIQEGE